MRKAVIFDLDNTLVECSKYYIECQEVAALYLSRITGLDRESVLLILSAIDLAATTLPDSFRKERFPTAFAATALAACHIAAYQRPSVVPYSTHMLEMQSIAEQVFNAPYAELPGARDAVEAFKHAGWYTVLYTKGDNDVQASKITRHSYNSLFDRCIVTPAKTVDALNRVVAQLEIDPTISWYVGDSLRDDIAPAQAAGFGTVLVKDGRPESWTYDAGTAQPTYTIDSVAKLSDVLDCSAAPLAA